MNLQDYIKEAEGYLFQLTDISNTLVEAIADRSAWQANIKVAQENYDTVEAGLVFDLITGDGLAATGKNAEQRNAAKDAELTKWRNGCDEWSELQAMKVKLAEAQSSVEQLEKQFVAVKIQAELIGAIIKALSGQS